MRIVTWNLNRATWSQRHQFATAEDHRREAWSTLASLGPDVALVQEAPPPPPGLERPPLYTLPVGDGREAWRSFPGPERWWCSAIASWGPVLGTLDERSGYRPLEVTHQGAYRVATIPYRDTSLVVVSVYALWDYAGLIEGEKARFSETSLHRTLSDLTPILDQNRRRKSSVIFAGDLNASTQFPRPYRQAYKLVHARIEALGLVNVSRSRRDDELEGCPCKDDPCRHIRTLEGPTPYQDDYIYASADLADAMRLIRLERAPAVEAVSDHYPLMAELAD